MRNRIGLGLTLIGACPIVVGMLALRSSDTVADATETAQVELRATGDAFEASWEEYFLAVGTTAVAAESWPADWRMGELDVDLNVDDASGELVISGEFEIAMPDSGQGGVLGLLFQSEEIATAEFAEWRDGMRELGWDEIEGPSVGDESVCVRTVNDDTVSAQCGIRDGEWWILTYTELPGDTVEDASNGATRLALVFFDAFETVDRPRV